MATGKYKKRKYRIEPYSIQWKKQFEAERKRLCQIFLDNAIAIEHVGSTAVPGLCGKPTIDILITVRDINDADALSEAMVRCGYIALGDYINKGSRLFVREVHGVRLLNVHVFESQHPHVKDMIDLRNYLRAHPAVVQEYGKLKLELFKKYPDDYGLYRKYKDDWMRRVMEEIK